MQRESHNTTRNHKPAQPFIHSSTGARLVQDGTTSRFFLDLLLELRL